MPQNETAPDSDESARSKSEALEALRRRIDALDDAILAQIERRVGAAMEIAELKRSETDSRLRMRPAREAAVIERLVGNAEQAPERLVRQVWREIMACCLNLQVHSALHLHAETRPALLADATRRRFGCANPMVVVDSPVEAIEAARSEEAVAVIELEKNSGWWAPLKDDEKLSIFECLRDEKKHPIGIAIGRIPAEDLAACPRIEIVGEDETGTGEILAASGPLRLVLFAPGARG